jgi:pSer/pThr/pTyr-binding forkhead associated (FHA) protein
MISPVLVFPEEYATTAKAAGEPESSVSRVLVLLDPEKPIKYPLYKETMTIGRADIADIQINNGFLSRLHARIVTTADGVVIEDAESKNGIRVNAKLTPRHSLKHGDVIDLGRLRFRFIDTAADDAE